MQMQRNFQFDLLTLYAKNKDKNVLVGLRIIVRLRLHYRLKPN